MITECFREISNVLSENFTRVSLTKKFIANYFLSPCLDPPVPALKKDLTDMKERELELTEIFE
jgi:hypothetical protein